MIMNNWKKYCRLILNIVIPLLVIWLVCFIGPRFLKFFLPFVIGWIIAMIANPLVKFLEKRVKMGDIPKYYESASVEVQKMLIQVERLLQFLPQSVSDSVNQFFGHIGEYLNLAVQKIASPTVTVAGNVVKSIPAALVYTIVTIFSSYLFIVDRDKMLTQVLRRCHRTEDCGRYHGAGSSCNAVVSVSGL